MTWTEMPLRAIYRREEESNRPDLPLLSVYRDHGVVLREGRDDNFNRAGEDLSKYKVVQPGDLAMNKMKTWQGSLGVSSFQGIVSPAYFVGRKIGEADDRFMHHLLRSQPLVAEYATRSKGIRPNQWDLSWDEFATIKVRLPPWAAQHAIADYLDTETARVDALIAKKSQLVERLDERIDGMLAECVGESSVGGGSAPEVEIRRVLCKVRRSVTEGQIVTAFRDGQVTARLLRRTEGYTEAWTENSSFQEVRDGDVVVHGLDGFAGAIGTAEAGGVCSPVYHVAVPSDGGDSDFYGRLLRVMAVSGYLGLFAISTRERALDFRNWDLFGRIPIPLIPLEQQRVVGQRIRALRPLRLAMERSAALALEHRQALITAAVTGELDVSRTA